MIIHGLTVCVDYAAELAHGIGRWRAGLASLTVVTTLEDTATLALAGGAHARVHATDAFYREGAAFNKGRAIEEARRTMHWSNWVLFFDADVVPPADWYQRLGALVPGRLYGCDRFQATPDDIDDRGQPKCAFDVPGVGYCQLFHITDSAVQTAPGEPLIDECWQHAGNYDNRFMDRWRRRGAPVVRLPFRLAHLGERENWFGRGHRAQFEAMQAERLRRGGRWDHETIGGRP